MLTADVLAGFVGSLLKKNFDGAVDSPSCHYEWWTYFCSKQQQVAIAAPRGHAKSTALTHSYTLAAVLFRERSYVILVSDTVAQAVQFLGDIKRELMDNEPLRKLFKVKEFTKDSEDDVIVLLDDGHEFRIQAKGSEQKVRGLKWDGKRPDLIVCDDLENDEIVMNKDRREKFRKWFYQALLPCRSVNGLVRYVGTILHSDSLLERLMPKVYQRGTIVEPLKTHTNKRSAWVSVKYRAHTDDFTKILWKERYNKEWLQTKRTEYIEQGLAEGYSQEYLNIPLDESLSYFKRTDFTARTKEDAEKKLNYYITADLAIGDKETSDYSVFLVAGIDENRHIHVVDVVRERLDGKEIVDMVLNLEKAYHPELFGIEEMQITKSIRPFLREEMIRTNIFPNMVELKHQGKDKMARARGIQARTRAHSIRFDKSREWYQAFEDECCTFPRSVHDDQVDAFGYLGMLLDVVIEAPTKEEMDEDFYLDELYDHQRDSDGRNQVTGY